ncbi:ABC transporter substrate-binding protein [Halosimplex aquaticum]|uniref:ABC transporter substrate-binding protein n=1 Tax=Halosimplex aquaticum TaxID=3026162 RepID=A0ABD5Y4D6_9EURY|nr:ABC transporter substrate-binding protein [Halosimplex aquaticum]
MSDDSTGGSTGEYVTRRRVVAGTATGLAASFAGCIGGGGDGGDGGDGTDGGSGTDSGDGGTPTMTDNAMEALHGWTGGDGAAAVGKLVDMWEQQHPDIEHDIKPIGGDANENLNATVARRLANRNPPDAFASWPGKTMQQYGGRLMSVSDVWEDAGYTDTMHPKAAEACRLNDAYRAVPLGSHRLNNLFYNVSVLEEAGVDPESLTSYDAFISALDKVKNNTDAIPMTMTTRGSWANLQYFVEFFLGTEGADAYDAFINGNGDKQAVVRALKKTKNVIENYSNEDKSSISFPEANDKLIAGNAAFFTMGNWAYGMYRNTEDFKFNEDWGWVPFPGTGDMYVWHLDSFLFPRDGNAPRKAKIFAEFLGQKDVQVEFNNLKGSIPLRTDVDGSKLTEFLSLNVDDLNNLEKFPPTLAHGLAGTSDQLSACKDAIASNFMGPYKPKATADELMKVF